MSTEPATPDQAPDPACAARDRPRAAGGRPPRIAVVDDVPLLRAGLVALLPGVDVVATHPDAAGLLAEAPDVDAVLLDLHLANAVQPEAAQGLAAVRLVAGAGYRVCLYSQEERRFVLAACVAAGARGLVSKAEPAEVLAATVRRVAGGEVVLPESLVGLAEVLARRGNLRLLGRRHRQLLAARARGRTYADIGEELHLAESTLRGYWADLSATVAAHLRESSAADIERALGLAPGDMLWPGPDG